MGRHAGRINTVQRSVDRRVLADDPVREMVPIEKR